MLCPKCHSERPDEGACPVCGTVETEAVATEPERPTSPVKKKEYLAKYASPKAKQSAFITRIVSALCALLIIISGFIIMNTALDEIPIFALAEDITGDNLEFNINSKELRQSTREFIKAYKDDLSKKEIRILEKFMDKASQISENPSISNTISFYNAIMKLEKVEVSLDGSSAGSFLEDTKGGTDDFAVLKISVAVIWIIIILGALLVLLSGYQISGVWAITVLILNILPDIAFVGFFHFLIVTAGLVVLAVFAKKFKKEFKAFNYAVVNNIK